MKVKLEKLVKSLEGLRELMSREFDCSTAFDIMAIGQKIQPTLDNFQNVKKELLTKYGVLDKLTGTQVVKKDKTEIFNKEWEVLMSKEIVIDIKKIKKEQLMGIKLKPGVLLDLEWMFEQKESSKPKKIKSSAQKNPK